MRDLTPATRGRGWHRKPGSHCEGPEEEQGRWGAAVTPALLWRPVRLHSPAGAPPGVTGEAPREERLSGPQSRVPCHSPATCSSLPALSPLVRPHLASLGAVPSARTGPGLSAPPAVRGPLGRAHTFRVGLCGPGLSAQRPRVPAGPLLISPHSPCMSVAHAPCGRQALPVAAPGSPGHTASSPSVR